MNKVTAGFRMVVVAAAVLLLLPLLLQAGERRWRRQECQ